MPGPLVAGERVLLVDPKDRRYLITLVAGSTFHTHAGIVAHDDLIGSCEGRTITGSTGRSFLVLRPTLSDVVLKMPRGAQVIYPKDLGAILIAADIGPGQRVLEAGVGSGALSMTALRAGASVVGYELRADFAERARANVAATLGQALAESDAPFGMAETQEIMRRTWHVEARSVRPDHRMVGHTGFLTTARRIEAGPTTGFKAAKAGDTDEPAGEG